MEQTNETEMGTAKIALPLSPATDRIGAMADLATPTVTMGDVLTNDGMMADGYRLLADMPDVLNTLDRIVDRVVNGKAYSVGTANRDDIHSDAMMELAAMLAMGTAVTPGTAGKAIRRVAQRYAMRTMRTVPLATGMDERPTDDTYSDADTDSATNGTYWDDTYVGCPAEVPYREGRTMLVKKAPTMLRTVELEDTYGKAPVPDDAYGMAYRPDMDSVTVELLRRYYPNAVGGNGLMDMALAEGVAVPIGKSEAAGKRIKDKKGNPIALANGDAPKAIHIAVSLATLHKRSARYSMAASLTHEQAVAIDAARSIGAIAPVVSHLGSKGDPTYMLNQSAPSAESDYFRSVRRNAETIAADETLYATPYDVERFYVPVSRYERNRRTDDGTLHIRGTVKRHRHILWGDRRDKRGKVTQSGIASSYGDLRQTIAKRLKAATKRFRVMAWELESTIEDYRQPLTLSEMGYRVSNGRLVYRTALDYCRPTYRVSYAPSNVGWSADYEWNAPDGSRFFTDSETVELDWQIADQWTAIRKAARDIRETEIATAWDALCESDPAAMFIENAVRFVTIRQEWRTFLSTIEIG